MSADRDPFALGGTDPLIALNAERLRIEARLNTPGQIDDDAAEDESTELNGIECQIAALVPISAAGAAIQVRLLQYHMTCYAWEGSHDQLTANLLAWIERLAEQPPAP
jgi:hypothetical protein